MKYTATFSIPTIPIAQPRQRHRVIENDGKAFAANYTPAKHPVNDFKATVRLAATHGGARLVGEPVSLRAVFVMPRPKSKMWKTKPMPRYCHTSKPDLDNLAKALKDALTGVIWQDDSQVFAMDVRKVVANGEESPRVDVCIEVVDGLECETPSGNSASLTTAELD